MEILGLSLIEIIIIVFLLVAGIVAIKIGVSFDINAWIEHRHKQNKEKLIMLCPHTEIEARNDGSLEIKSLFHSPPGTIMWICSRCQLNTSDSTMPDRLMKYYAQNPQKYFEQMKGLNKVVRKLYKT